MVTKNAKYLVMGVLLFAAACARKKKADDFQSFGGISYNAAPRALANNLGMRIAVQAMDIDFDGKVDGLYVCRTGSINAFTIGSGGSGYTNSPNVTITPSGTCSTNPQAVAVVANGKVERVHITNPGSGCTNNSFNIVIDPPGSGTQAAAIVAAASGGRLTRISMVNKGAGYAAPTVTIGNDGGGSGATAGVHVSGGAVDGIYLLSIGDGRYTTPPTITLSGDTGTGATASVAPGDLVVSELDAEGNCTVSYDPTNPDPNLRHIPQMLFTWPVRPTTGLDTNGDGNADYYLFTEEDGTARVMTNSDGSGAAAQLIVKNPAIDETNDWLYRNLKYGQVIGFDVLGNNTIANNILGKIALDREDPGYVDAGDPMPIISPIRNGEYYAAPMDVNILCADKVACNAVAYSLSNSGIPVDPNFGSAGLDPTGVDYSGTMHAIRPGDSSTISFQSLPFGNYTMKYIVRDAAGRISSIQQISFTIGRKPDLTIVSVPNRYVSQPAGTSAQITWTADTGDLTKPFRYIVIANASCIGYTRAQYISPPPSVLASGGPHPSGHVVTTNIAAAAPGMVFNAATNGINYVTICAITCEIAACSMASHLSVWGDAFETIIRDDNAPSVAVTPSSGMFDYPQQVYLTGSTTIGGTPTNGTLAPSEICYTWGADAGGNPLPGVNPTDPAFPCTPANNVVNVTGSNTTFNVGCPTRASVTDLSTNLQACAHTPGIYYIKYRARDAAGNVTAVFTQAYAIGITPQITTVTAPNHHLWSAAANWGNTGDATPPAPVSAGVTTRVSTSWTWQTDFPGTYEIRILRADLPGTICNDGILSTGTNNSGSVAALTNVTSTILASDMATPALYNVGICYTPDGGGPQQNVQRAVWKLEPKNPNLTPSLMQHPVGSTINISTTDFFEPVNALRCLTFSTAAGSTGPDSNNGGALPNATGSTVNGCPVPANTPNTAYQIPNTLTGAVTTLAYDLVLDLCSTAAGCTASSGPDFTSGANGGTSTLKYFAMLDINSDSAITTADAVFVDATSGNDANPGTARTAPKRSLQSAMTAATGGKAVYIISGNYCATGVPPCLGTTGTLNVPTGTSLFGGFTSAWYRPNVASNQANITAGSTDSAHSIGISLGTVNVPVYIEGLNVTTQKPTPDLMSGFNSVGLRATAGTSTLRLYKNTITAAGRGSDAPGVFPGGSYGVHISGVNTVILQNNSITANGGWHGLNGGTTGTGAAGAPGLNGDNGQSGLNGCVACSNDSHWHAGGGTGGAGGLGAFNRGGNGGDGGWQDDGGSACGQRGGCDGETAPNGGGGGGARGTANCNGHGSDGGTGATGSGGSNGAAPGANFGQIVGGFLEAYKGNQGTDGTPGRGGGGGGGGAGAECNMNDGGGGGGGGAGGGAAGTRGDGGHAGGPSVGIFISSVSSLTLTSNTVSRGTGGNGGNGQNGGGGGSAGARGWGGDGPDEGGNGGNGGFAGGGGAGGHGSGGNGGPSFGLVFFSTPAPNCSAGASTFTGGGGGAGGTSAGNAGNTGHNAKCFQFTAVNAGSDYTAAACGCN